MRNKGNSKHRSGKGKSKKKGESDENEFLSDAKRKKLQEDLAKAMLSAAKVSMKTCKEKLVDKSNTECEDLINSDDDKNGTEEEEVNSEEQSDSSDGDASNEEEKMNKKNCYANGCCNVPYEQSEKVQ